MEKKELVFTANGVEQRITAKLICEEFDNGNGTTLKKWHSGNSVVTDKYSGKKWIHKTLYGKDGILESEITRVFDDDSKLISICEDKVDGSKFCTIYEYDDHGQISVQKTEIMRINGSTKAEERWYQNFYDGNKIDSAKLTFDKNICYREIDEEGRILRFIDSEIEGINEYPENGNVIFSTYKNGKLRSKNTSYKSDDGLVTIQKSENVEDESVYYEIKDCRKSAENPQRISATYKFTEKM